MEDEDSSLPPPHENPPKPPDKISGLNYKVKILASENIIDVDMEQCPTTPSSSKKMTDMLEACTIASPNGIKIILLNPEDNQRLHATWKYSLIIKVVGARIAHQALRTKLHQLWQNLVLVPLINLGGQIITLLNLNLLKR